MKVNVIGGSGFIGTRLCQMLADSGRSDFKIIDKRPSQVFPGHWVAGDVRSVSDLRQTIDEGACLINLAAEHQDNVRPIELYEQVNVEGARNICQVARERAVPKILFTSSVAVYGNAPRDAGEATPIRPINEYGRTKALAEEVFRAWHSEDQSGRSLLIVRPSVVFGEGNRGNVYNLLRQIHARRFLMVGTGENLKSMAYVGNVAALLHACIDAPSNLRVVNYADKPDFTTAELVAFVRGAVGLSPGVGLALPLPAAMAAATLLDGIARVTGRKFPISRVRIQKFCSDSSFSSQADSLGFTPPYELAHALGQTIRHEFPDVEQRD